MNGRRLRRWLLVATAAVCTLLALRPGEPVCEARIVQVERGEVRQIAALRGRVTWLDETAAYATMPGYVEEIYVQEGQRVAQGQALLRLRADGYEEAVSAFLAAGQDLRADWKQAASRLLEGTVVRSPVNGNVRQILTAGSAPVTSGMPVVILSSTKQAIVCVAQEADARALQEGMAASLTLDGREVGRAEITQISDVTADALTGRMMATVTLTPQKPLGIPAGTELGADVTLAGRGNVTVLPVEAVTERETVWWVSDGRCTEIPAKTVLSDEIRAWVDLPEGLWVAVGEFEEGQRVREAAR